MCRQNWWGNSPHVPGFAFEELGMRRTFEIEAKLLMNWKIAVFCLRISVPAGVVLDRVKLLNGGTELQPRAFGARRHPQQ